MRETNAPVLRSPKREANLRRTSGVECERKLVDEKEWGFGRGEGSHAGWA
jgi:hypothetical protein